MLFITVLHQLQVHVAALEVQNVKKAISRYGTLPKGARIGAYLESLRQSGMNNQESNQNVNQSHVESKESPPRSLSPRTNIRTQPQMIRSNSSSGVTTFHAPHPPSSPTASKFTRNKNVTRNTNVEVATNLRTFRVAQNPNPFRGGSPSRSQQPSLADLEFPPPPTDLPPPPEEFDGSDCVDSFITMTSSSDIRKKRIPISPLTSRKLNEDTESSENIDVINLQPSVKEASSRFGVNLRKREPSSDSMRESKDDNKEKSPQRASLSLTSPSVEGGKSPMSIDSDVPTVGSPLEPLPPPPSFPESGKTDFFFFEKYLQNKSIILDEKNFDEQNIENNSEDNKNNVFKNKSILKEMELKLVAEIKERTDGKIKAESPIDTMLTMSSIIHDPVAQLVSELSESLNIDKEAPKKTLTKTETNGTFIPQLKKVETTTKKIVQKEKTDSNDSGIFIDFKSRLRKVDNGNEKKDKDDDEKTEINKNNLEEENNKRESTASSDSGNLKPDEGDDKRKSTGSISSLKKLWEPKDLSETSTNIQLSPKLALKNVKNEEFTTNKIDQEHELEEKLTKVEKKMWQVNDEKPSIPTKPPVKPVKPIIANRPTGSAIYATPIAPNKPPISAKPTLELKTPDEDTKTTDKTGKDNILEISQALENTLNSLKTNPTVSSATWLQLSDKIGLLHTSCMDYADNVVPAHTKFHFRELLTRLETQARQLRSAGSRNSTENIRYLNEVNNTIKDVVNVVFR